MGLYTHETYYSPMKNLDPSNHLMKNRYNITLTGLVLKGGVYTA
jgi:hypothetical protein